MSSKLYRHKKMGKLYTEEHDLLIYDLIDLLKTIKFLAV